MSNPYAGIYNGFAVHEKLLRARLYAVQTAPTINISVNDLVCADVKSINSPKLGVGVLVYDAAVMSATPGDEYYIIGAVQECFDEDMNPVKYIAATEVGDGTVAGYVLVADHPAQTYQAVVDAAITLADFDLNYPVAGEALYAPDTNTKISKQRITTTSAAVTATIPIRLISQLAPGVDSYASAGCRMICMIQPACHLYGAGVAL